jgi:uncharacterized metal-binding protein YceD (DUF177 family)
MTPESVGPLSRPVSVERLPDEGLEVLVEASPEERAALAKDFKLPAIHALTGRFRLRGSGERIHVEGAVNAKVSQICVVTLDAFESEIEEEVEVDFARPGSIAAARLAADPDHDPPDELSGDHIDLGALTAEFLALGLDPYPRKPGASFSFETGEAGPESPFAGLKNLKGGG